MVDRITELKGKALNLQTFLFLFLALLIGGCSSSSLAECTGQAVEYYLGTYTVDSAVRYRGGLTSAEQAQERVGNTVVLGADQLTSDFASIKEPRYFISCYPNAPTEGEVPVQKWSSFYGLGVDRDFIDVLAVYAEGDPENEPSYYFEIVAGGLLELFDGWAYYLTPNE